MYDLLILGAGPSGLTAGIYAARGGLKTAIIEKTSFGGQLALTSEIENYPGFENISGFELAYKMQQQAEKLGVEFIYEEITDLDIVGDVKSVKTQGNKYEAKAIIIAMGASPRLLGLDKEKALLGAGVSYCATCDGAFFRGKDVAVIGGGNTAVEDAIYLSKFCNKVYIVHRRNEFRATKAEINKMTAKQNVELVLSSVVSDIFGESKVEGIEVTTGEQKKRIDVSGVFVAIGRTPNTTLINGIDLTDNGYIVVDRLQRTSEKGVYAVGDIVDKSLRQVVTACSDGAVAAECVIADGDW
ncbi:MAG: thioredoxin-disulfide reductase [Clostridia bacterium]|nr:thioredoxin-disulfide reductase [Clostridia bacterium]MDY5264812.1 thioredoxin-disulfide reductase [Eubacteriales bacterium]